MPQYLANLRIHKLSGIPADDVQNNFCFAMSTTAVSSDFDAMASLVSGFYQNVPTGGTVAPATYMSAAISTAQAMTINFYDVSGHLNGTPHGSPVAVRSKPWIVAVGTDSLPDELAACVSFHSDYGTDVEFGAGNTRPRARHRGRIYFGPLKQGVVTVDATTKIATLNATTRLQLSLAAAQLKGNATYTWSVWSRTLATFAAVSGGWVDDAFDIQRRRGIKSISRLTF